jgi:thiol:disulfide interchange protein DsbA
MNKSIPYILPLILLTFLTLSGCLTSESQAEDDAKKSAEQFTEGKHYVEIFPEMNTDVASGQVEVIELFWLGCPHCSKLEPTINAYKQNMPSYVSFKQVPAVLNPSWKIHAKAFYTAQHLDPNNEKNLIGKLFDTIHKEKNSLATLGKIEAFFTAQGYTSNQFNNTINSMAVNAEIGQAKTIGTGSQSTSVPTIIINGKYRTSPYMAGGEDNLIKIVNMLVQQERK